MTPPPGRSSEGELVRKGVHPVNGLTVCNCSCPAPNECRQIMWRYAEMGDSSMCCYLRLPGHPKKEDTNTGQHVIQYRENVFHHLYGNDSEDVKAGRKDKRTFVAYHHFHPLVREVLESSKECGVKKLDKFRVSHDVAKAAGLTKRDECQVPTTSPGVDKTYFASPSVRMEDSRFALKQAEREYHSRRAAEHPGQGPVQAVLPGRKTPKERALEQLTRKAEANPAAVALKLFDQAEEIRLLKEQLKSQAEKSSKEMASMKEDFAIQREKLVEELILSGLNRRSIVSEKYHQMKPWVSKFFFGRPWKEHKARGEAYFAQIEHVLAGPRDVSQSA